MPNVMVLCAVLILILGVVEPLALVLALVLITVCMCVRVDLLPDPSHVNNVLLGYR